MKHFLVCLAVGFGALFLGGLPSLSAVPPSMPFTINLWPGLAPGETTVATGDLSTDTTGRYGPIHRLMNVARPQIIFYPAGGKGQVRPTVLICPGGGYYIVTTDIEGSEIARWLNGLGYNAAVLHYRVPDYRVPSPARRDPAFQDVQQAMSLLRANAGALNIDTNHLGIIGFSAGGHLAARLACATVPPGAPMAEADKTHRCRPDFVLLIYPAFLWDRAGNHPSPETQPHANMPPMFLRQTRDDDLLDADSYATALQQTGVLTDCRIYDKGGHGYGMRLPPNLPAHRWPEEAAAWIRLQVTPPASLSRNGFQP